MFVTLAPGLLTLTLPDGLNQTTQLSNVTDVTAELIPRSIYGADTATQVTTTFDYKVRLHLVDNRFFDILMGQQTGDGVLWVNTLAGANIAVADIQAQMP